MIKASDVIVADAAPGNWVDRWAPAFARPYLRMARADRPIGSWLLLWPCLWSTAYASMASGARQTDYWILLLFTIGAFVMRGAGCVYNDIVDRDYDIKVARTKSRPIPSGQVSVTQAAVFMVFLALIGLLVLIQLNNFAILLGIASLGIVAIYPFMKRITYWPQFVLGLAFSWGGLMGWAAIFGALDWPAVGIYVAAILWTIGYDTIYAHQDKDDDALIGLKSTALRFGEDTKKWLSFFYISSWLILVWMGFLCGAGLIFYIGLILGAVHLAWQIITINIDDEMNCLYRFRSNRDYGTIIFAAILLDMAIKIPL